MQKLRRLENSGKSTSPGDEKQQSSPSSTKNQQAEISNSTGKF